ncbi:GNAT family N-acetyltransferase [Hymenobacter jeollabukensis]|uniref:GNAT family N-acetyltransferase n=1 Tax=Hymenobacter jeollabukensis TaxID=2025313 RepID=A0A5R8WR91_9BACT|nr:GNAT family N-acetyltransferase [Hymenobacter jeollabukensis]TLM93267.1 GNAT family N-acetyltransferase [Hymenobacter jeollabukensis]
MSSPDSALEKLAWDSAFFGFPVGRLQTPVADAAGLRRWLAAARQQGYRLLYWFVEPANMAAQQAAAALALRPIDHRISLGLPLAGQTILAPVPDVRPVFTATPALRALAQASSGWSRFRRDAHFAPGSWQRLYNQWLQESLRGRLAREVLVHDDAAGQPLGLLTLAHQGTEATIGLLAVAPTARRQGVGGSLLDAAAQRAQAWGCQRLTVVTQRENQPAVALYQARGFRVKSEALIYHLWL